MDPLARHRLSLLGIDPAALARLGPAARPEAVVRAFVGRVPCETLSEQRRWRERPADPEAWPRTTDRFLREAYRKGWEVPA